MFPLAQRCPTTIFGFAVPVEGLDFISIFLLEGLRIAAMFLAQPDHDRSGFRFAPRVDFRVTIIEEADDRDEADEGSGAA